MERFRPHIPWSVRYIVITKQVHAAGLDAVSDVMCCSAKIAAQTNLRILFRTEKYHLDHNPALILRPFNKRTGKYTPAANDPNFLIYRTTHEHHIKTNVRGDGAQFSDTTLRNRERRRDRPSKPHKPIRQRTQWPPKGSRKMRSRIFVT